MVTIIGFAVPLRDGYMARVHIDTSSWLEVQQAWQRVARVREESSQDAVVAQQARSCLLYGVVGYMDATI